MYFIYKKTIECSVLMSIKKCNSGEIHDNKNLLGKTQLSSDCSLSSAFQPL